MSILVLSEKLKLCIVTNDFRSRPGVRSLIIIWQVLSRHRLLGKVCVDFLKVAVDKDLLHMATKESMYLCKTYQVYVEKCNLRLKTVYNVVYYINVQCIMFLLLVSE